MAEKMDRSFRGKVFNVKKVKATLSPKQILAPFKKISKQTFLIITLIALPITVAMSGQIATWVQRATSAPTPRLYMKFVDPDGHESDDPNPAYPLTHTYHGNTVLYSTNIYIDTGNQVVNQVKLHLHFNGQRTTFLGFDDPAGNHVISALAGFTGLSFSNDNLQKIWNEKYVANGNGPPTCSYGEDFTITLGVPNSTGVQLLGKANWYTAPEPAVFVDASGNESPVSEGAYFWGHDLTISFADDTQALDTSNNNVLQSTTPLVINFQPLLMPSDPSSNTTGIYPSYTKPLLPAGPGGPVYTGLDVFPNDVRPAPPNGGQLRMTTNQFTSIPHYFWTTANGYLYDTAGIADHVNTQFMDLATGQMLPAANFSSGLGCNMKDYDQPLTATSLSADGQTTQVGENLRIPIPDSVGLQSGHGYAYRAQYCYQNVCSNSGWNTFSINLGTTAPTIDSNTNYYTETLPTNNFGALDTDHTVLGWKAPTGATAQTKYYVEIWGSKYADPNMVGGLLDVPYSTAFVSNPSIDVKPIQNLLNPGMQYAIFFAACNGAACTQMTPASGFNTEPIPTTGNLTDYHNTTPTLTWKGAFNATAQTQYTVQLKDYTHNTTKYYKTTGTSFTIPNDQALNKSDSYLWGVIVCPNDSCTVSDAEFNRSLAAGYGITFASDAAPGGAVNNAQPGLYFSPDTESVQPGDTVTMTLDESSGGQAVNAVQAVITYPTDTFENFTAADVDGSPYTTEAQTSDSNGVFTIARGSQTATTTPQHVATITFHVKQNAPLGAKSIATRNDSQIIRTSDRANIITVIGDAAVTVAANSGGSGGTGASAPGIPTLSSPASGITLQDLTPTLSWTAPSGATASTVYTVSLTDATATPLQNLTTSGTSIQVPAIEGLLQGKIYSWTVTACNGALCSSPSQARTFITPGSAGGGTGGSGGGTGSTAPGAPTQLSPANNATVTNTTPTLIWTDPSGSTSTTHYDILLFDNTANQALTNLTSTTTSIQVPASEGLVNGKVYSWAVRACNGTACSSVTPWAHFGTPTTGTGGTGGSGGSGGSGTGATAVPGDIVDASGNPGQDGHVKLPDLAALLNNWNHTATNLTNKYADINGDGKVDVVDLSILLSHFEH